MTDEEQKKTIYMNTLVVLWQDNEYDHQRQETLQAGVASLVRMQYFNSLTLIVDGFTPPYNSLSSLLATSRIRRVIGNTSSSFYLSLCCANRGIFKLCSKLELFVKKK